MTMGFPKDLKVIHLDFWGDSLIFTSREPIDQIHVHMTTQTKLQYTPPRSEELEIDLEGVIALSGKDFENPDITNTDI